MWIPAVPASTDLPCSMKCSDGKKSENQEVRKVFGLSLLPIHLRNRVVHSGVFLGTMLRTFGGAQGVPVDAMTLMKASAL